MNKLKMDLKYREGITLISLVVTIIVLIILAGVSINLILGQYGIVNRATSGAETYSEKQAKEKLELELSNMYIEKNTNINYNEDDYLTTKLSEKGFSVNGNIVIVDGYQFQIDRTVPKIMNSLGKGTENSEITLTATSNLEADYTKSTIKIEITYEGTLKEVNLNGESLTIPEAQDGKYVIEKEVEKNGNYNVFVKDSSDGYKIENVEVKDISEDIEINNEEALVKLAQRVNAGATYEGRTISLTRNLDLSSVCGPDKGNWIPIGTKTNPFKGNFDGNNYTINNIYIKISDKCQGLFGYCAGNIKNININGEISGTTQVGGICGFLTCNNISIQNCKSGVEIHGDTYSMGGIIGIIWNANNITISNCENSAQIISNTGNAGGIVGVVEKSTGITIEECKNNGIVKVLGDSWAGGIVGITQYNGIVTINNSINTGNITANKYAAGGISGGCWSGKIYASNCYNTGIIEAKINSLGGIIGNVDYNNGYINSYVEISNCYNTGTIVKKDNCGGIIGYINSSFSTYKLTNNYWLSTCGATYGIGIGNSNVNATPKTTTQFYSLANTIGTNWVDDTKNGDGTWKYNNGYPILKWQVK